MQVVDSWCTTFHHPSCLAGAGQDRRRHECRRGTPRGVRHMHVSPMRQRGSCAGIEITQADVRSIRACLDTVPWVMKTLARRRHEWSMRRTRGVRHEGERKNANQSSRKPLTHLPSNTCVQITRARPERAGAAIAHFEARAPATSSCVGRPKPAGAALRSLCPRLPVPDPQT